MASASIPVDQSIDATPAGRNLLYLRDQLEQAWAGIKAHFAAMSQQKNGDGSQDSHFAQVATVYKFTANPEDGTNTANHSAKQDPPWRLLNRPLRAMAENGEAPSSSTTS